MVRGTNQFGWQLVGICVKVPATNGHGPIVAVSPDGVHAYVEKAKRKGEWYRTEILEAVTAFGRKRIEEWVAARVAGVSMAIEFPTIPIDEEKGRRKIKTDEL